MMSAIRSTGMVMAPSGSQYQDKATTQFQLFECQFHSLEGHLVTLTKILIDLTEQIHLVCWRSLKHIPHTHTPDLRRDIKIWESWMHIMQMLSQRSRTTPLEPLVPGRENNKDSFESTGNTTLDKTIQNAREIGDMTGTSGLMESVEGIGRKQQQYYDQMLEQMRQSGSSGANEVIPMGEARRRILGPQSSVQLEDK